MIHEFHDLSEFERLLVDALGLLLNLLDIWEMLLGVKIRKGINFCKKEKALWAADLFILVSLVCWR